MSQQVGNCFKREFISHTRRIQSLYKRIARNAEAYEEEPAEIKYVWALVRAEFEKHRHVRDLRVAKKLAQEGEEYLIQNEHPQLKKFTFSPGGIMFEREHVYPDNMLDLWHPLEKASYPYYFERREQLKKEFIKTWERNNPDHSKDLH